MERAVIPPVACQKMRNWIRNRYLICSGSFFIFQSVEYSAVERFEECVSSLGGTLISVEPAKRVWIGQHRQVILYEAKASLHTPNHGLKQYWLQYGSFYTKFNDPCAEES
jgi:phycoerythrin-associated linker protein